MAQAMFFWLCFASVSALRVGHTLRVGHANHVQDASHHSLNLSAASNGTHAFWRPLPSQEHPKKPGQGYPEGATLYPKQQLWVKKNGANSIRPPTESHFSMLPWPWRLIWDAAYAWPLSTIMVFVVTLILWVCVAQLYLTLKPECLEPWTWEQKASCRPEHQWKYGIFACCCARDRLRHTTICACAFLCPAIRWADTVSLMESRDREPPFWTFYMLFVTLCLLAPLTLGVSLLLLVCVGVIYRQRMRQKYHQTVGEPWMLVADTCVWLCLPCVAIAQEAREVEEVGLPNQDV